MKRPSSGLGVGLWVVGGLVGAYFGIFALVMADEIFFHSDHTRRLPDLVLSGLETIYRPLIGFLGSISLP